MFNKSCLTSNIDVIVVLKIRYNCLERTKTRLKGPGHVCEQAKSGYIVIY